MNIYQCSKKLVTWRINTVYTIVLVFWLIQCLYFINSEVAWVLVSSGIQVQQQIILNPDYLPDYLFLMTMVKKVFLEILQHSQRSPCARISFVIKMQLKKETLAQVFSGEYCEIFTNTFFKEHPWWLPLVKLEPSLWNQQNFSSSYFGLHLISCTLSMLWQNSRKTRYPMKIICRGVHSYCNTQSQSLHGHFLS